MAAGTALGLEHPRHDAAGPGGVPAGQPPLERDLARLRGAARPQPQQLRRPQQLQLSGRRLHCHRTEVV